MNCKNCNHVVNEKFCPNCGQPAKLKRIDGHYLSHEIEHVLHVERGLLYTVRELAIKPGATVREFISENRTRLVKPIIFIIITSLIYSVVSHFFHIEQGYIDFKDSSNSTPLLMFKWSQEHYGYANIIMGVFIAVWLKIFFRKQGYNLFEILILLCFVIGMSMLIYTLFVLFLGFTKVDLMQLGGILGVIYCSWAIGQFFNKNKPINYLKALVAYMLGMLTWILSTIGIGMFIDMIIKH